VSTISGVDTTEAAVDDDSGGATRALDCWATVTASDRTAVGGPHGALACGDVPTGGTLRSPRWFVYGLLAIAVVALGVRIGYTLRVADDLVLTGDAQTYHLLAARLAYGDGYVRVGGALEGTPTAEFPPLFPAVLAVVDAFGGDAVTTQRLFTSVLGVGTVVLIGLAGRRVRGPAVGLVAAGGAAVYPMLFQVDGALMAESLYALLVAGFLYATYRAIDEPLVLLNWVLAGALAGLAALTRTEGLLLLPVVLVPAALRRRASWRSRATVLGAATVAMAVVIMPWVVRNGLVFDRLVPISNNSGTLVAGANCDRTYAGQYRGVWRFECVTEIDVAGLDEPEIADRFREVGFDYASDHRGDAPRIMAIRVLRTFGLYEPKEQIDWESFEGRDVEWQTRGHRMFLVLLPLSVIGAVVLGRARRAWWPLVGPIAIVVVTTAIGYGNQRFRILAEPGILILAAVAVVAGVRAIRHYTARVPDPESASLRA
jgi:4-amino-4-deoxy-L-arabinose transferase-like glycosyltransferase